MRCSNMRRAVLALGLLLAPLNAHAATYLFTSTGSTNFTVPSDWNNANNQFDCVGTGGGTYAVWPGIYNGGGGGGGGYAGASNISLTPGATIVIRMGSGYSAICNTMSGGNCWQYSWDNPIVAAQDGAAPSGGGPGGVGGGAAYGSVQHTGGNGAANGGGGGAAGPHGDGAPASGAVGGTADAGVGAAGGASGGGVGNGGAGGNGSLWGTAGPGGGGGWSGGGSGAGGNGGMCGGGAGPANQGGGAQGIPGVGCCRITYTAAVTSHPIAVIIGDTLRARTDHFAGLVRQWRPEQQVNFLRER